MTSERMAGRLALVTGAARMNGIGRATALRLAGEGADVIVAGRNRDPQTFPDHERAAGWQGLESVAAEIRAMGRRALALPCDVRDAADVAALFARAEADIGVPDAIVNNVGSPAGSGIYPIVELDDAIWTDGIETNLGSVYQVSKAGARAMIAAGRPGAIVNVASIAARAGSAYYGAYCAAKFGVIGLTQQMAQELARHGIRVNCVCPGVADTDMLQAGLAETARRRAIPEAELRRSWARHVPLGRVSQPADQAAAIAFLLGTDAAYITGQSLNVDGGVRMD